MSPSQIDAIMILLNAVRADNEKLEDKLRVMGNSINELKTDITMLSGKIVELSSNKEKKLNSAQKYVAIGVGVLTFLGILGGGIYALMALYYKLMSVIPVGVTP